MVVGQGWDLGALGRNLQGDVEGLTGFGFCDGWVRAAKHLLGATGVGGGGDRGRGTAGMGGEEAVEVGGGAVDALASVNALGKDDNVGGGGKGLIDEADPPDHLGGGIVAVRNGGGSGGVDESRGVEGTEAADVCGDGAAKGGAGGGGGEDSDEASGGDGAVVKEVGEVSMIAAGDGSRMEGENEEGLLVGEDDGLRWRRGEATGWVVEELVDGEVVAVEEWLGEGGDEGEGRHWGRRAIEGGEGEEVAEEVEVEGADNGDKDDDRKKRRHETPWYPSIRGGVQGSEMRTRWRRKISSIL
uniref:Glycine-rich cell wall structural protein 1.0-like n=1 Tax=Elaeis guineensis var. tenera TaxID=51953 RepID=A0A8N4IB02_ELAGV|nr:glycine-rich cell wall structural protein 1.0-like [Elaeis guineensis]